MPGPNSRIHRGLWTALATWLLSAVFLVGCASPAATPSPSANVSVEPSAEASQTFAAPTATPGSSSVPSSEPSAMAPTWKTTGSMPRPHAFHTATLLPDGRVLVTGGLVNDRLDGRASAAVELYDPNSGSWTATRRMTEVRWGHTATLLPNGKVLVAGGYVNGSDSLDSSELYDPSTGRWTITGDMTVGRGGHRATLLPDGTVLVIGGGAEDTQLEGGPRSATAELYDPHSGKWTATGKLTQARMGFSATLLPDGTVLVAGGDGGFTAAELYDPGSRKWTAIGSMAEGRFGHTATLLTDGTVLVAGGCACSDPGAVASAELYQPSTGAWTATGSMGVARIFHAATRLSDGRVLVVNDGLPGDRTPSAELYDPAAGGWAATASPARSRYGYTTTLLQSNLVLLVGDYDYDSQASTELYDPGSGS
jgi:hypothetical protein